MQGSRLRRSLVFFGAAALAIFLGAGIYAPIFWSHDFLPLTYLHSAGYFRTYSYPQFLLTAVWPYWNAILAGIWTFVLLSALGRRWLLHRSGPGRPRRKRRSARAIALATLTLPSVALGAWGISNEVRGGGRAEFEEICSRCHAAERPLAYMRSPEAWRITVERMQEKIPGLISDEERESALRYLLATRSWTGEQLFEIKCQQACHDAYLGEQRRPEEEWERIVTRIRLKNPFFMTQMQEREILGHIRAAGMALPASESSADYAHQRLYEEKCVECHTLDIIVEPESRDLAWEPVLERMQEKAPWLYSREEALGLQPWIERMQDDPTGFAKAVPHLSRGIIYGAQMAEVAHERD